MNLKEAFPKFVYLHALQPKLDKANHTVEDFIELLKKPNNSNLMLPPEIVSQGTKSCIVFLEAFGWPYVVKLITTLYP